MSETSHLEQVIYYLSRLPGLGKRSARRAVLHLVQNKESLLQPLAQALLDAKEAIKVCHSCGNIDSSDPCHICNDARRQDDILCIVEEVADLWAIERSNIYRGYYHVLGGTLSAIEGRGPDDLNINSLVQKIAEGKISEIILAMNATVDGQTTAHYITQRLKEYDLQISRIAHGVPIGGELDYLDDGTLGAAFKARVPF
ncbi:recombination mediator RecR [Rickettsiales bacterium]|nr:recombination mediator RecR [Rickettsiales bacterium]